MEKNALVGAIYQVVKKCKDIITIRNWITVAEAIYTLEKDNEKLNTD